MEQFVKKTAISAYCSDAEDKERKGNQSGK
jgi:hypothetical protein